MSSEQAQTTEPKGFWKSPFMWAGIFFFILMTVMYPWLRKWTKRIPKPPPVFGQIKSFSLIDQDGKPFTLEDLKKHVYIVNFFFTRCPTICPKQSKALKRLQKAFDWQEHSQKKKYTVRFLSVTVDPNHDKPSVLKKYAKTYGADLKRWRFLTGTQAQIDKLAEQEFKTGITRPGEKEKTSAKGKTTSKPSSPKAPQQKAESLMQISHSGKLILVDKKARIRGYYNVSKKGLQEINHRAMHVLWEHWHKKNKK